MYNNGGRALSVSVYVCVLDGKKESVNLLLQYLKYQEFRDNSELVYFC